MIERMRLSADRFRSPWGEDCNQYFGDLEEIEYLGRSFGVLDLENAHERVKLHTNTERVQDRTQTPESVMRHNQQAMRSSIPRYPNNFAFLRKVCNRGVDTKYACFSI